MAADEGDEVTTLDKHGGRVERRRLRVTTMLNRYLDWPGVARVGERECTVTTAATTTVEVHSLITGVPRERADAATLLAWTRGHWAIENRLHYVRDATMGEDANRTRSGSGPQVLAALRNRAISLLRQTRAANIAAALRRNAARTHDLPAILCSLKH